MSFGYNHIGTPNPPILMPLLGNGAANFMQPLPGPHPLMAPPPGPGLNDNPLDFNNVKSGQAVGAAPMDLEHDSGNPGVNHNGAKLPNLNALSARSLKIDELKQRHDKIESSLVNGEDKSGPNLGQGELLYNGVMGVPQNFMMMSGMMMDPTMLGLQQFPIFGQLSQLQQQSQSQSVPPGQPSVQSQPPNVNSDAANPIKELISCKSCTLFPPNPNAPPPTTRERPPGCRTVFVGGLPENITEDIIREVFDRCGEITTLRLSKKNFCHIRFMFEASVDSAIYLSGYRMRIGNHTDAAHCGRLHVDFAQARDDQYEWECRQRQLQREQRHRERLERDRLRPLSPPPIVHYTDHEAVTVSEKLKGDDSFGKAVQVLITWLERGDCSKKNSNTFYSMIQSTNSHVRRLSGEKVGYDQELQKAKDLYKKQIQSMLVQFNQIKKVFNAASHKKVWDHFTKAQRKNIELWKKQALELRSAPLEDLHDDDEMEMSDEDKDASSVKSGHTAKRAKLDNDSLKEENDSLRCQLQVYKNEVDLVKSDLKNDTDIKDQQIKVLQETIRNLQTQLLENKAKERENLSKVQSLEEKLKAANVKELLLKTKIVTNSKSRDTEAEQHSGVSSPEPNNSQLVDSNAVKMERLEDEEARIISLVSTFLVVHPFGASTDIIWSYVHRILPGVRPKGLLEVIGRHSSLFSEEVSGVGAKIERKWRFIGFGEEEGGN